ncbi:MAG: hypothetical protein LC768_07535 [Acidobacteria bacterium]|nr:hypothetical protein [Acidobacteriota bacterium]
MLFSLAVTETFAVDFTVNLTTDQHDANTADAICDINLATVELECSLRAAVEQANNLVSNDRVLFNLPSNSTIILTTVNGGEIPIIDTEGISNNIGALEIIGTGANNLTIDGGEGTNRIFYIIRALVAISGVTLTGGNGTSAIMSGSGGAIIANTATLILNGVHVTTNSGFGNSSAGGVFFNGGANHRIINSTFSANTVAGNCGGFLASGSSLTVVNSTISGNIAGSYGGGLCNTGTNVTLRNVTITNNTAREGGGILLGGGTLNFGNTIVAGNTATHAIAPEIRFTSSIGTITSAGGNLIGDSPGDSTNTETFAITYHPTDIRDVNPLLGALQNNGGTTPTHALLVGSPAVDAGLNALAVDPFNGTALAFDQRGVGFPRIRDGNGDGTTIVDIGAFEVQLAPTAATVSVSGRVTAGKRYVSNAVVHLTSQSGKTQTARTNFFGYYSFKELAAGETYIINVYSKRYQFTPQVVNLTEDLDGLNFTAQ